MRVVACPSDRNAVGWYRLGLPAQTLVDQNAGIDFTFQPGLLLNTHPLTGQPTGLAKDFFDLEPDLLILQRPVAEWQLVGMRAAQKRGIAVVVELDDDYHTIDKRNFVGRQITTSHLRHLGECVRTADLITVSTQALADRWSPHNKVVILPNFVPEWWLGIDTTTWCRDQRGIVGWTGSIGTHLPDIGVTQGGVGMALAETDGIFRCYGDGNANATGLLQRMLCLSSPPDVQAWTDQDRYPHEIAKLDIGIAPLADTAFNRSKSWLKPLEYAAVGVPCVMSPSPEYQRIHDQHGIGIIARERSREWKRETLRLLADPTYRNQISKQGREAVRESLTMEANTWRWQEAWESAIANKHAPGGLRPMVVR